jgi:hypothetical protein
VTGPATRYTRRVSRRIATLAVLVAAAVLALTPAVRAACAAACAGPAHAGHDRASVGHAAHHHHAATPAPADRVVPAPVPDCAERYVVAVGAARVWTLAPVLATAAAMPVAAPVTPPAVRIDRPLIRPPGTSAAPLPLRI